MPLFKFFEYNKVLKFLLDNSIKDFYFNNDKVILHDIDLIF